MIQIQALASGSSGNCYRISDGSSPLLIECGIPWKRIQKALEFRTRELAGCLISHDHLDHCKAVRDALRAGIDCYMSAGTTQALNLSGHRLHILRAREQFRIGTWTVLPFETQHDAAEPLGFLLQSGAEKLLYLTDSFYCRYRFAGLTHVAIECNYASDILAENVANGTVPPALRNRILRSHFSLQHVKEFLQANDLSRVTEIHLIHLSDANSDAARFKREIQELTGRQVFVW